MNNEKEEPIHPQPKSYEISGRGLLGNKVKFNNCCWGFFGLDAEVLAAKDINFDKQLKTSEDFDLGIALLRAGLRNGIYYEFAFYKEMGSTKYVGGNRSSYNVDETRKQTEYLEKKYPGVCEKFFSDKHGI